MFGPQRAVCVFRRIRTGVPKIIGQSSEDIRTVVGAKRRSGPRVKELSELSQDFAGYFRTTGTMRFEGREARSAVPNGGSAAADRTCRPPGRGPRRSAWGPVGGRAPVAGTRSVRGGPVRRMGLVRRIGRRGGSTCARGTAVEFGVCARGEVDPASRIARARVAVPKDRRLGERGLGRMQSSGSVVVGSASTFVRRRWARVRSCATWRIIIGRVVGGGCIRGMRAPGAAWVGRYAGHRAIA